MDFLDDIIPDTSAAPAKARAKFLPKMKPRPKKVPPKATVKQNVTPVATTDATSTQTFQSNDPSKEKLNTLNSSCLATNCEVLSNRGLLDFEISIATEDASCDFGKSTGENVDAFPASDSVVSQLANVAGASTFNVSSTISAKVQPDLHHLSSVSFSPDRPSNVDHDLVSCKEDAVLIKENFVQTERPQAEGAESLSSMDPLDVNHLMFEATATDPSENQFTDAGVSDHTVLPDITPDLPSTTVDDPFSTYHNSEGFLNHGSSETLEASQVNNATHASATADVGETDNSSIPPGEGETAYEFIAGLDDRDRGNGIGQSCVEESAEPVRDNNMGNDDNGIGQSCVEESAEPVRDNNMGNDDNLKEEKTGKRKRRTKKSNEGATANANENAAKKEKHVSKRKKAGEAQEKTDKQPPKKFSRSTRRKRNVDKSLLEMPEDEIDYHRLPIRDMIILADIKERNAKKEAAAAKPAATDEGPDNRNTSVGNEGFGYGYQDEGYGSYYNEQGFDDYYDEQGNALDQDRDPYDDIPTSSRVQTDASYFNYMSHMNRKPTVKWSMQDTELFYQGVRQFGSDLSMIQQLFPGLTRHQIKLKYKKEERQHPMMLMDALTGGAKGFAQFHQVIERLNEQMDPEQRELNSQAGDSADMGNEGGGTDEKAVESQKLSEDGAAKSEEVGADAPGDREADETPVPMKSYDSDGYVDDFQFDDYKGMVD